MVFIPLFGLLRLFHVKQDRRSKRRSGKDGRKHGEKV